MKQKSWIERIGAEYKTNPYFRLLFLAVIVLGIVLAAVVVLLIAYVITVFYLGQPINHEFTRF